MKRLLLAVLCVLTLLMLGGCMTRVPAGNVGIKFNKFGSNKGVDIQDQPTHRGNENGIPGTEQYG